jgi:hypothetical protein
MRRYYFHVTDGRNAFQDEVGTLCSTPEDAAAYGNAIGSELATEAQHYNGFTVHVIDEDGYEVARVPIRPN